MPMNKKERAEVAKLDRQIAKAAYLHNALKLSLSGLRGALGQSAKLDQRIAEAEQEEAAAQAEEGEPHE